MHSSQEMFAQDTESSQVLEVSSENISQGSESSAVLEVQDFVSKHLEVTMVCDDVTQYDRRDIDLQEDIKAANIILTQCVSCYLYGFMKDQATQTDANFLKRNCIKKKRNVTAKTVDKKKQKRGERTNGKAKKTPAIRKKKAQVQIKIKQIKKRRSVRIRKKKNEQYLSNYY